MTIINALPFTFTNGTIADATQVDANFDEVVNDVNSNAAHNGVNNDITALTALTTPLTPAQGGSTTWVGGTSTGSANAQAVASPVPTGFTLTVGNMIVFIAGFSNTDVTTFNINGTGAKNVFKASISGAIALAPQDVVAGQLVVATYDGTQFELLNPTAQVGGYGPANAKSSATTTDLGLLNNSHFVAVLGTTTITSFGSSASINYPIYTVQFAGILTLTHNATSLILPGGGNILTAANDTLLAQYLGSGNWRVLAYYRADGTPLKFSASFLQGYKNGLTLSTAGGTGTMGIAVGEIVDSTNVSIMQVASAYAKTTSSWAVGSGNGGLDTGAIANATWYYWYAIQRPDTGVVDIIFSLSASAPTLPANYTLFHYIGSGLTDGSAHWTAFTQTGNKFIWSVSVNDVNAISTTTSRVNKVLTVPRRTGIEALFRGGLNVGATGCGIIFTSLQESDQTPAPGLLADLGNVLNSFANGSFARFVDTSAQIGVRSSIATSTYSINTYGWIDLFL